MSNIVEIKIKPPIKLTWILLVFAILVCTNSSWMSNLSSGMFGVVFFAFMSLFVYALRLFAKTLPPPNFRALTKIVITENDNVVFTYSPKKEETALKQSITKVVKGNVIKLYKNDIMFVGKVYRNTLADKNDWEVLQSLFSTKLLKYNSRI